MIVEIRYGVAISSKIIVPGKYMICRKGRAITSSELLIFESYFRSIVIPRSFSEKHISEITEMAELLRLALMK